MSALPPGFAPRLLIFDLDGTLVDSMAGIVASFNHALGTAGAAPLPAKTVTPMIGLPLAQMFAAVLPAADEPCIPDCIAAYRAHYDETAIPAMALFPGVRSTLAALHADGRTLTVATTKGQRVADAAIDAVGLRPLLAHVLGGDRVPYHKPHPALVLHTLALTGCAPADALVVGDSTYDILMAKSAGVRAAGVTTGVHAAAELRAAGADALINALAELPPLVGLVT